jgi:hypothetical protein
MTQQQQVDYILLFTVQSFSRCRLLVHLRLRCQWNPAKSGEARIYINLRLTGDRPVNRDN